jgi:hypothetical protein
MANPKSLHGVTSGTLPNGGSFSTSYSTINSPIIVAAAHTLEVAVSASIVAAITGASGVGSMDRNVKTTLSGAYAAAVAAGV